MEGRAGSGKVTEKLLGMISATPELREAFSQHPYLAEIASKRMARDLAEEGKLGGASKDIHNLRTIIAMGKNWPDRLDQARSAGLKSLVPAAAAAGYVLYPEAGLPAEISGSSNSGSRSGDAGWAAAGRARRDQLQ